MLITIAISGYRSVRNLVLPLEPLTVITGANGTGKSSLYRALRLLGEVAQGRAIGSLAAEGGLQSTLWAGPDMCVFVPCSFCDCCYGGESCSCSGRVITPLLLGVISQLPPHGARVICSFAVATSSS